MRRNKILGMLMATFLAVAGLTACSDEDGDVEPMKWKTEVEMGKEHSISVPVEGGTYLFTCTNYKGFWISYVSEDDIFVEPGFYDTELRFGEWSWVKVEENVMTVTVSPNDTGRKRCLEVSPQAGNAFDYFIFNQAGQ